MHYTQLLPSQACCQAQTPLCSASTLWTHRSRGRTEGSYTISDHSVHPIAVELMPVSTHCKSMQPGSACKTVIAGVSSHPVGTSDRSLPLSSRFATSKHIRRFKPRGVVKKHLFWLKMPQTVVHRSTAHPHTTLMVPTTHCAQRGTSVRTRRMLYEQVHSEVSTPCEVTLETRHYLPPLPFDLLSDGRGPPSSLRPRRGGGSPWCVTRLAPLPVG